jgi:hypothetical protein
MKSWMLRATKADGPLGIRTSVWLMVFGMFLLCVFVVRLFPTRRGPTIVLSATRSANAKRPELPADPHVIAQRTASKYFAHAAHKSGGGRSDAGEQLLETALSEIEQIIEDRHSWIDPL